VGEEVGKNFQPKGSIRDFHRLSIENPEEFDRLGRESIPSNDELVELTVLRFLRECNEKGKFLTSEISSEEIESLIEYCKALVKGESS
jgi:hypothetical protein